MRKTISIFTGIMIVGSLLCGCAHNNPVENENTSAGQETKDSTVAAEEVTEPEDRHTGQKIVWATSAKINNLTTIYINNYLADSGYDFYFEFIDNAFIEGITPDDVTEENIPDIISSRFGTSGTLQGTYELYYNNWLVQIDDYLESEEGKLLKSAAPEGKWKECMINGHYYGLSGALPFCSTDSYYINSDLAEELGIDVSELEDCSIDDLGRILDGKTIGDNVVVIDNPVENDWLMREYFPVLGIRGLQSIAIGSDVRDKGGMVVNVFEQETAIKRLKSIREYKEKGYFGKNGNQFLISIFGNNPLQPGRNDEYKGELRSRYENVSDIKIVRYLPNNMVTSGNFLTGVCSLSKNKELALKAFSVAMADTTVTDYISFGVPGVDYHITDGIIDKAGEYIFAGNSYTASVGLGESPDKKAVIDKAYEEMYEMPLLGVYIDLHDYNEQIDNINAILDSYIGLQRGEYEDVEATVKKLNEELKAAGIDEIIDAANAQLKQIRGE